jgi:catabolite repression protein CreC
VSYADGTIIIYDKEREDGTFTPQDPNKRSPFPVDPVKADDAVASMNNSSTSPLVSSEPHSTSGEWDPAEEMFVSMPPWHPASALGREWAGKNEKAGKNPISHWKLSRRGVVGKVVN